MLTPKAQELSRICRLVDRYAETMRGNCGMFAWALAGWLGRQNCEIVFLWDMVDDRGRVQHEGICQHILVKYQGVYYDGWGAYESEAQILKKWTEGMNKTRAGWTRPLFTYARLNRNTYRLIKASTGWMAYPSMFEGVIRWAWDKLTTGRSAAQPPSINEYARRAA